MLTSFLSKRMLSNIGVDFPHDEDNNKTSNNSKTINAISQNSHITSNSLHEKPHKSTTKSSKSSLNRAIIEGIVSAVESAITDDGSLVNSKDENGLSPLHVAAQYNRAQVVNTLLDFGAKCDALTTPDGLSPLHMACRFDSFEAAKALLERGTDPNIHTREGKATPLHICARFNRPSITSLLVSNKGIDLESRDQFQSTPLHHACNYGNDEIARILMCAGARIDACALEGLTILHAAITGGNTQVFSTMIDSAVQHYVKSLVTVDNEFQHYINQKNDSGNSPLHLAVKSGNLEMVKMLIQHNAEVNAVTKSHQTPLHIAAMCDGGEAVAMLLNGHGDVNCQDDELKTPLHYGASFGNDEVIKHLLDHGAQLDLKDANHLTPFLCAATTGQVNCGRMLMEFGADVDALDERGRNCLHLAVENEQCKMVALLMQNKAKFKLINHFEPEKERTPLHYAALTANTKILELILDCKPNCSIKDVNRKTALHLVVESGKTRCVEKLARSGLTSVFDQDDSLRTPLHYAAMHKRRKMCHILLQFGAEINCQDINRWTPIMWAAKSGDLATTSLFLEREAQLDCKDNHGNTLLHVACNGPIDVTKLLLDKNVAIALNNNGMSCLDCAVEQQNVDVVMAIVKHNRWQEVLRIKGHKSQSPMSMLIQYYPEAAAVVMDRCVQRPSKSLKKTCNIPITYNFRFLDPGPGDSSGPQGNRYFGLADMVKYKRQDLLTHPLARKLLNMKWNTFGRAIFLFNFVFYLVFLNTLTQFAWSQRDALSRHGNNFNSSQSHDRFYEFSSSYNMGVPFLIVLFVFVHIVKELYQMFTQGMRYFLKATNLLEWCLYGSALVFVSPFLIRHNWIRSQTKVIWQVGTVSVFLGFANVILFLRVVSYVGLYVTMYLEVVKTLVKVASLFVIFIVAFAVVFYILFKEEAAFEDFYKSVVKTTVMTVGELDYQTLLVDGLNAKTATGVPRVPFPEISFVFFFLFLLGMPIVLINLLIGLAVGDIGAIQQSAFLTNKSMKINFVSEVESKYPRFIANRLYKPEVTNGSSIKKGIICKIFGDDHASILEDERAGDDDLREDPSTMQFREVKTELSKTKQQIKAMADSIEKQQDILIALAVNSGISVGDGCLAGEGERFKKGRL